MDVAADITVCICTYRRPAIAEAIESVFRQEGLDPRTLRIVVADNDVTPSARPLVEEVRQRLGVRIDYVHAPAKNISIARNAALDAVTTRWAAFLDDDERAAPDWLRQLLLVREGQNAVVGQSIAVYPAAAPGWAPTCDFHSNRITGRADNAYTSNVLLDKEFLDRHCIRFLPAYGQTGGEDTIFFRTITEQGGTVSYCAASIAYEDVPPRRATLAWVMRRKFRYGETHGLLLSIFDRRAFRLLPVTAGVKAAFSILTCLALLPFGHASVRWAARAALHLGAVSYTLTRSIVREYA